MKRNTHKKRGKNGIWIESLVGEQLLRQINNNNDKHNSTDECFFLLFGGKILNIYMYEVSII